MVPHIEKVGQQKVDMIVMHLCTKTTYIQIHESRLPVFLEITRIS